MAEPKGVLNFSNELGKFFVTREHLFSIGQKFQLKIYNAAMSILKIPINDDMLRVICHLKCKRHENFYCLI